MSELFSEAWIKSLGEAWNKDTMIYEPLSKANFSATIGYGFIGDEAPQCIMVIHEGKIVNTTLYHHETVDWDLRASKANWQKWIKQGFGITKLGPAVATRSLQFAQGDYRQMIRNPLLSRPFLRHFVLMSKVDTQF